MRKRTALLSVVVFGVVALPLFAAVDADSTLPVVDQARQPRLVLFETFQRPG